MQTDEMRQAMSTLKAFSEKDRAYHARQNYLQEQRNIQRHLEEDTNRLRFRCSQPPWWSERITALSHREGIGNPGLSAGNHQLLTASVDVPLIKIYSNLHEVE
jgi:hypothetical protein